MSHLMMVHTGKDFLIFVDLSKENDQLAVKENLRWICFLHCKVFLKGELDARYAPENT